MIDVNQTINTSNQFIDFKNVSFYNQNCINEINKFSKLCTKFKVDVLANYNTRFEVTIILLVIFIAFRFYVDYSKPQFINSEFWKYFDRRLDFIIAILCIFAITFMFF